MIHTIKTISEFHHLLGLPKPKHPLMSVLNMSELDVVVNKEVWKHYFTKFFTISVKSGCSNKVKYGQSKFDFDEAVLTCIGPNQVVSADNLEESKIQGYAFTLDPDFLLNHPLAKKMEKCDFFSYHANEALFLSEEERKIIFKIFGLIQSEYENNIDGFSQEVLLSNIELLLVHINRYYSRQFITRKNYHNNIQVRVKELLEEYYQKNENEGLPTVHYLSDRLNLSPAYLSDMLKNYTGLSAQQHIHESLIYKAKELLTFSELSVSEIAFKLGFQHPQSFVKLFKQKASVTPLKFRQSYN